jgi:hypothetical protein
MNFNLLVTCPSDVEDRHIGRSEREFGRAEWIGRSSIRTLLAL